MADPATDGSSDQAPHDGLESSIPAESSDDAQITNSEEANPETQQKVAEPITQSWRIRERLSSGWKTVKSPESTNLILAVATIAIAVFTWLTYDLVKSGSQDTTNLVNYSRVQANAASDQADAAQQFSDTAEDINSRMQDAVDQLNAAASNAKASIRATQTAMRLDERAWVVTRGFGPRPEIDQPWALRIVFSNTGKTPAKTFEVSCIVQLVSIEDDLAWTLLPYEKPTLLAPNDEKYCIMNPVPGNGKVTKEMIDYLADPRHFLYVYGAARYEDIFNSWHWLTFCGVMHPDGQAWDACWKGNDTGEGKTPPPPFKVSTKIPH